MASAALESVSTCLEQQAHALTQQLDHLSAQIHALRQAQLDLKTAEQASKAPCADIEAADNACAQSQDALQQAVTQSETALERLKALLDHDAPDSLCGARSAAGLPAIKPDDKPFYTLTLKEVASWQHPALAAAWPGGRPPIVATLPSLQRGAVWRPIQVELLWDSILRGFPIGSLVVSPKLQRQASRVGAHAASATVWSKGDVSHHLLDGQQRCNAIALGYLDPCDPAHADAKAVLWLDLAPEFAPNSSRVHLLRIGTKAHPWGYDKTDALTRLGADKVRTALKNSAGYAWPHQPEQTGYKRPTPIQIWPLEANRPIPLAWLLKAAEGSPDAAGFWQQILTMCKNFLAATPFAPEGHWACRVEELLKKDTRSADLDTLAETLLRVPKMHMVALGVPERVLYQPTRLENQAVLANHQPAPDQRIANVEHLFQRLNAGGTELRGNELMYSMIKAYWPGIEHTIDSIKDAQNRPCRPPATEVALLGARLALSELQGRKPKPGAALSVSALRAIAQPGQASDDPAVVERRQLDKQAIEQLFQLAGVGQPALPHSAPIAAVLRRVDDWLVFDPQTHPDGLPAVLRSRLAEQAPEVFHFLMSVAKVSIDSGVAPGKTALRRLLGLVTALHWFGQDRAAAVRWLWELGPLNRWLSPAAYKHVLRPMKKLPDNRCGLLNLRPPIGLKRIIPEPDVQQIEHWSWENELIVKPTQGNTVLAAARRNRYWPMLDRLRYSEPLLMYGQRIWMHQRFGDYDPSVTGFWDEHNRPWDFDHLLPQNIFKKVDNAIFLDTCKQWGYTTGNLHILPFEENRSRQDSPATTLPDAYLPTALLDLPHDLRPAFSIRRAQVKGDGGVADRAAVHGFVLATRIRLLRLYKGWYSALDIGHML